MQIEILHIEACPNWQEAGERVHHALSIAGMEAEPVRFRLISTAAEAEAVPFAGSPTIVVDGVDLFAGGEAARDLACRVYVSGGRLVGLPSVNDLVVALQARESEHAQG